MFTAYALSADKLDLLERLYRKVDISKKSELFWQMFAKNLLSKYLNALLSPADELEIPVIFPVCYIPLITRYYWVYGQYNRVWKKYMNAATTYPFLRLVPSFIKGRMAIDGGAVDCIPLYPLLKNVTPFGEIQDPDVIIVLHFDAQYDYRKTFKTDIPVLDLDVSYCNGFSKAHYDFSGEVIKERLQKSYEYGDSIGKKLFSEDLTKEQMQAAVNGIFMEEHAARQQQFSIERLVTILNVISKSFRRDTNCMKKLF
ncbi:MAG: hypothetical protein K2N52_03195 [Clostridia bacterium]|nr:hypothetical protein [Clostridia bacterium]